MGHTPAIAKTTLIASDRRDIAGSEIMQLSFPQMGVHLKAQGCAALCGAILGGGPTGFLP